MPAVAAPDAPPAQARVLLADDDRRLRADVRLDLEQIGFRVCSEAADAASAVAAAVADRPDACVLDVSMPGGGIAAAAGIRKLLPSCVIVMLTASYDPENLLDAVLAGASGSLAKETDGNRLGEALTTLVWGDRLLLPGVVPPILATFDATRGHQAVLTRAERRMLELLREDWPALDIARELSVPPADVRRRLGRVLEKLRLLD